MRSIKAATASETMLDLGRYHLAALVRSEGTKPLASAFQPVQGELQTAADARVQAEKAMTDLHVGVSFTEDAVERAIRQASLLAHAVDNNATSGPAYKALFPDGLDAELRPIGASQVAAAITLRERLDTQPAAVKVKAQVMDGFDKALSAFRSALEAREAGETKVSQARAVELAARERFVSAYDSNIGALRQMFPRDRRQQNLYFDNIGPSHASADDSDDNTSTPSTPTTDSKTK
jgi:hypothetical protein